MKPSNHHLTDAQLDALLSCLHPSSPAPSFEERILRAAWLQKQKQPLNFTRLFGWLSPALLSDTGRGRLIGAMVAILLSVTAGYYAITPTDDDDLMDMIYAIDDSGLLEG